MSLAELCLSTSAPLFIQKRTSVDLDSTMRNASHLMSAAEAITSAGDSARFRQPLAVDPRLALQIVDCDVGVVPSKPWPDSEAPSQVDDTTFREPSLGQGAGLPQVGAASAGIAVEVVFSDRAFAARPR
jgi:hypothetical protein